MAESVYHPTYKAPTLIREKALLQNSLSLRPAPWSTTFGTGEAMLQLLTEVPAFSPACVIDLDIDGTSWTLELDDTTLLLRHSVFTGSGQKTDERALPPEVRRALLQSLLEPPVSGLSGLLNRPILLRDVRFSSAQTVAPAFSLGFSSRLSACNGLPEQTVFLRLSPLKAEYAAMLVESLRTLPQRECGPLHETLKGVPLEVGLESGYLLLKPEEAAGLAAGDVLLPDAWTAPETLTVRIRHTSTSCLAAPCAVMDGNAVLSSPLSEEPDSFMNDSEQKSIDIRLSFELDRRLITLGELEALTEGYTFALNGDMQAPVTIRANGKAIARGRLVDMNGVLGVQISETL